MHGVHGRVRHGSRSSPLVVDLLVCGLALAAAMICEAVPAPPAFEASESLLTYLHATLRTTARLLNAVGPKTTHEQVYTNIVSVWSVCFSFLHARDVGCFPPQFMYPNH